MYKQRLIVLSLFVIVNLISSIQSLPSFRWRKSVRSDTSNPTSNPMVPIFNTQPQSQIQTNSKLIDLTFLQSLPKFFSQFQRPQQARAKQNDFFNSAERPMSINRIDTYNSYETLPNEQPIISTLKKSSVPVFDNDLENNIYSTNDPYEDDDVIVIPFTKQTGQAFKDEKPYKGKTEEGVPSPPNPVVGFEEASKDHSINNMKIEKKFGSKVITDSEIDLDTGDDLPMSLTDDSSVNDNDFNGDNENTSSKDFKVQFSDLHPVYVKPPKEFQPIFYPNRDLDNNGGNKVMINRNDETIKPIPIVNDKKEEIPSIFYPTITPGSWVLGGLRFGNNGGFGWESLMNDETLYGYNKGKKIDEFNNGNENSLDFSDKSSFVASRPSSESETIIKNSNELFNRLKENDKLEFISINEPINESFNEPNQPKSRSFDAIDNVDDEIVDLKKEKKMKKPILLNKFKKSVSSLPVLNSKNNLIKRKLNLRPLKVKILTKASKTTDANKLN